MSSEPVRQPANDLIAFDIRRQSPEQIANLFARWKEQRKRLQAPESRRRPPHLKPVPPIVHGAAQENEKAAAAGIAAQEPGLVRYSSSFEALLAAREQTLAQRVWNPDAGLATLGRPHPPRRRSKTKWFLAGAASVVAVAAVAGGALWERSAGPPGRTQAGAKPDDAVVASPVQAATYPMDIPMAEPFVARATAPWEADWPMRQALNLALMKAAPVAEAARLPLMPQLKPPAPVVQTASKPAAKPAAARPETEQSEAPIARVELPLVPSVTTTAVSVPVAEAAKTRDVDARPNGVTRRGNDSSNVAFGSNGRVASSSSRPTGASGSSGSAAPGSGSTGGSTGGSEDPGAGGTGADPGGSDPGGGTGGADPGGSDPGGSDPGGGVGGGDAGGAGGDGDSGGGDTSGSGGGSGGGDSAGDSGDGDGSDGESGGGGESGGLGGSGERGGIGGAIGGAIGGLGDAVGGALGGGKGSKGDNDKSKGQDKDKAKAD